MIKLTKEQAKDLENLLENYKNIGKKSLVKDIMCNDAGDKIDYPYLFELEVLDIVNVVLNGYELKKEPYEIVDDYIEILGKELTKNSNNHSSIHIRGKIDGAKELARRLDISKKNNIEENEVNE